MVKIVHIIETLGRGGAERQLVELVRRTDCRRFSSAVCHLYPPDDLKPELDAAGIPVVGLGLRGRRDAGTAVARLRRLFRSHGCDIVHTWLFDADFAGRIAARLAGVPAIAGALQNSWYEPGVMASTPAVRMKMFLIRRLDAWTGKWSGARFVAASRFVLRSAVQRLGFEASRMEVIYNAVDPALFAPSDGKEVCDLRRSLLPADSIPVLICTGRLVPQKGHAELLDALGDVRRAFPSFRLLLAGRGEEERRLKVKVSSLGLGQHVLFLGQRSDVRSLLEISDIFVFPSLRGEGLPVALIEAMSMRKPCVAWNVEPNPEVVDSGSSGVLVDAGDVAGLSEAICSLGRNPEERRRIGERARATVEERFNIHRTVRQFELFYERLLREAH